MRISGIFLPSALKGIPNMTNTPSTKPETVSKDETKSPIVAPAAPVTEVPKVAPALVETGPKI